MLGGSRYLRMRLVRACIGDHWREHVPARMRALVPCMCICHSHACIAAAQCRWSHLTPFWTPLLAYLLRVAAACLRLCQQHYSCWFRHIDAP